MQIHFVLENIYRSSVILWLGNVSVLVLWCILLWLVFLFLGDFTVLLWADFEWLTAGELSFPKTVSELNKLLWDPENFLKEIHGGSQLGGKVFLEIIHFLIIDVNILLFIVE
jgi:hypothetical protein